LLLRVGHDRREPAVHPALLRPEPRCRTSRKRIGVVGDCEEDVPHRGRKALEPLAEQSANRSGIRSVRRLVGRSGGLFGGCSQNPLTHGFR
jgi:hypothetical protein